MAKFGFKEHFRNVADAPLVGANSKDNATCKVGIFVTELASYRKLLKGLKSHFESQNRYKMFQKAS